MIQQKHQKNIDARNVTYNYDIQICKSYLRKKKKKNKLKLAIQLVFSVQPEKALEVFHNPWQQIPSCDLIWHFYKNNMRCEGTKTSTR